MNNFTKIVITWKMGVSITLLFWKNFWSLKKNGFDRLDFDLLTIFTSIYKCFNLKLHLHMLIGSFSWKNLLNLAIQKQSAIFNLLYSGSFSGNADWSFEKNVVWIWLEKKWCVGILNVLLEKKSFKLFRYYKKCQKDECAEVSKKH